MHAGTSGHADRLTRHRGVPARAQDLQRRTRQDLLAEVGRNGACAEAVNQRLLRAGEQNQRMVLLAAGQTGGTGVHDRALRVFDPAMPHHDRIFARAKSHCARFLTQDLQHFVAREADAALGRLAVRTHLHEKLQARLPDAVGHVVVRRTQVAGIILDALLPHQLLDATGHLQIEVRFLHVRPGLRPLDDLG